MTTSLQSFADLSDGDLLATVHRLAIDERRATASLIASLAELDERRLYLAEGYSSLFTYCTRVLHLSEHAAYGRIEAARVARKYPVFLERLAAGDLPSRRSACWRLISRPRTTCTSSKPPATRASETSSIWSPRFDRSRPFRLSYGSCRRSRHSVRPRRSRHAPPTHCCHGCRHRSRRRPPSPSRRRYRRSSSRSRPSATKYSSQSAERRSRNCAVCRT